MFSHSPTHMNKLSVVNGSHLPVLMQAVAKTNGDVLEIGMGNYSTPYLHWACVMQKRKLVSYDDLPRVTSWAETYKNEFHEIHLIDNWDEADIEKPWDVALVDHNPSERRIVEIKRLADFAKYIVVHDTNGRWDKHFHFTEVYPLFKYKHDFLQVVPSTTVLSNFVDVSNFMEP